MKRYVSLAVVLVYSCALLAMQEEHVPKVKKLGCCAAWLSKMEEKRRVASVPLAVMSPLYCEPFVAKMAPIDTSFEDAVLNGNWQGVLGLFQDDLVNIKNGIGWTPLHYAIRDRNDRMVAILLASKTVDITLKNGNGFTAKQLAEDRLASAKDTEYETSSAIIVEYLAIIESGQEFPYSIQDHKLVNEDGKIVLGDGCHK